MSLDNTSFVPGKLYVATSDMLGLLAGEETLLKKDRVVMGIVFEPMDMRHDKINKIRVLYKGGVFTLHTMLSWWVWFDRLPETKEV